MKNEELKIRRIENFFQLFNYYKSREREFDSVRAINIYIHVKNLYYKP